MKRFVSFLLALVLTLAVCPAGMMGSAETEAVALPDTVTEEDGEETDELPDEGDDSLALPAEIPDEDQEEETWEARDLRYGDDGDDVLDLQTRLQDLYYYSGNLSGRFREGTRAAVKEFQKDFGLEETGEADVLTQSVLYATLYRPLRYGSEGDDVKELQLRLTVLGYYKGKISGNYLEGTQAGIRTFQEKNGLTVTGVADPETQTVVFSQNAVFRSDVPDATPTPVPDLSAFVVDDNDTVVENGIVMPDEHIEYTKTLKNGSSGKLVKQLQTRITELGYYTGPISGNYAVKTVRAVKQIQSQNALKVTGVTDEETWNTIFNNPKVVLPDNTPKPTPVPTPVPFAITVDVENQVTTVYGRDENGEYTQVIRQMLCSTGTRANPSDVGDWVLNGRHANWCVFPKWGNSYARYWTRINSSIAFHSVIYTAVSNSAVDVSSYKKLGKRASHGCIRLTVADAKWIYDNIGEGTVVSIVENMKKDPELRDALKLPPFNYKTNLPEVTPMPTAEPVYVSTEKPVLQVKRLRKNSEGEAVYLVQRKLTELGFYTGKCSGKILDGTVSAIKAFQRANGLYPSGEADQKLIDLMYGEAAPTATPAPTPAPKKK